MSSQNQTLTSEYGVFVPSTSKKIVPSTKKELSPLPKEINDMISKLTTTSSKIRLLDSKGYSRWNISLHLQIRYQHVRQVLITPVKSPK